jgi:GT2 family glycosyltransferase
MKYDSVPTQTIVTVLGMHRSGTSLVTRLLNLMGVFLGSADDLIPADRHNERGYWEHTAIVSLNDEILHRCGGNWHQPPRFVDGWAFDPDLASLRQSARSFVVGTFENQRIWGWKDPRTCLTLPFWQTVVLPTHIVICLRNPLEVVHSIQKSHNLMFDHVSRLWLTYVSSSLRCSQGINRFALFYEDLMQNPRQYIVQLAHFIGRSDLVDDEQFMETALQEVSNELRHYCFSYTDVIDNSNLHFAVRSLYAALRGAVAVTHGEQSIDLHALSLFGIQSERFLHDQHKLIEERNELRYALEVSEQRLAEVSARYEGELAEREQRLAEVSARYEGELAEREQRLAEVSARYEGELAERERRLKRIEAELQQYKRECSGIGYKALRRSRTLFRRFFPDNSVQRALYVVSRRLISRLRAQRRARRNAYPGSLPDTLTMRSCNPAYDQWLLHNVPSVQELKEQRAASLCLSWQPLISVIMPVYNVPTELLTRAIDSVIAQSYPKWELCIVDDCSTDPHVRPLLQRVSRHDRRIRVSFADRNRGIAGASNACMEMARGDFVVFLDNDDELAPHALFFIAELLNRHPDADVIYSDEDKIAPGGTREHPFFKPDFSPDLLLCHNYICHMLVVRRSLVMDVGGFREEYDGAQDYDLILRVVQRTARNRIYHIPDILYHWRMVEGSTALNYWNKPQAKDATLRLIDEYLKNLLGQDYGTVEYVPMADNVLFYPRYALKRFPLVSIVISTRDKVHLLRACIESLSRTTYPSYEIVLIDNNSQEQETKAYFDTLRQEHPHIRIIEYPHPFNYSAINNFGIRQARGEVIILLNNDTELLTPDWIEIMLGYAQQRRVGAVGVKLLYPNGTIQHAGVILGVGGVAGHSHKYYPADHPGYCARLKTVCNYSAVTAACMMFRRDVWQQAGGLDERLAVTFNDVDFCLRIRALGYDIVYTPQVQLLHHESMSVGRVHLNERTMDAQEIAFMKQRWGEALYLDPFYNLNLTLDTEDYAIHPLRRRQYMATLAKRGRK